MTTIQTKYCKILDIFTTFYSERWVGMEYTVGNGCKILVRAPALTPNWEITTGTQSYFDTYRVLHTQRYFIVRDIANTRLYTPGRSSSHFELHKWWNSLSNHEKIQIVNNL